MPKRNDIQKILIIGSGPSAIGRNGEYDAAATQSIKLLKHLEYTVSVVNSDITTLMTDTDVADSVYVEPLTPDTLMEIIRIERPDAILPIFGGKTALQLTHQLAESGFLGEAPLQVLGTSEKMIRLSENHTEFKSMMSQLGIGVINGKSVDRVDTALHAAENLDFPLVVRPSFCFSGAGVRLVYNQEELQTAVADAFSESIDHRIIIEAAVLDWKEVELVGLRDRSERSAVIGHIENVDPMGIHSGDSLCTVPMLTVPKTVLQQLEQLTVKIMAALEVTGIANVRFALSPHSGDLVVVNTKCRISRSSMLVSRVQGLPLARLATALACGMTLEEIALKLPLTPRPSQPEKVAVKFPKWSFGNYLGVEDRLDTRMRAVGEAVGFGGTYKEALMAVIRSIGGEALGQRKNEPAPPVEDKLMSALGTPSSRRQFQLYDAIGIGAAVEDLAAVTGIDPWFIRQLGEIADLENMLMKNRNAAPDKKLMARAKASGFSDHRIAALTGCPISEIQKARDALGITARWASVSKDENTIPAHYATYTPMNKQVRTAGEHTGILIIGSGPHRVGRGTEFDHSCVHASSAVRQKGFKSVILDSGPLSKVMDPDTTDELFFSPLTPEDAVSACRHASPEGVVLQFGGREVLSIGKALSDEGYKILGTSPEIMQMVEDAAVFRKRMREVGIPQPDFGMADGFEAARSLGRQFGYPLIVRPLTAQGVDRRVIIHNESALQEFFDPSADAPPSPEVLVEQFLEYAIEVSADALLDGRDAHIPAVSENIELAGVHEGDSACVIPPYSTPLRHVETIEAYIRKIGKELDIRGLFNARFAVYKDTVYLLEAKCRASRTLPFVSKVCRIPMAESAIRIMMGEKIAEMGLPPVHMPYFCVKESVFPFDVFPEVDPLLGPVMQSTGGVQGMADSFGMAYYKSQQSAMINTPIKGAVLITVTDEDKPSILEPARRFMEMGFTIKATKGTGDFLRKNGIPAVTVRKLGFGRPHLVDEIKTGQIHVVINTPSGKESQEDDAHIRKAAIRCGIPNITTPAGAMAAAKGIEARRRSKGEIKPLQEYYRQLR